MRYCFAKSLIVNQIWLFHLFPPYSLFQGIRLLDFPALVRIPPKNDDLWTAPSRNKSKMTTTLPISGPIQSSCLSSQGGDDPWGRLRSGNRGHHLLDLQDAHLQGLQHVGQPQCKGPQQLHGQWLPLLHPDGQPFQPEDSTCHLLTIPDSHLPEIAIKGSKLVSIPNSKVSLSTQIFQFNNRSTTPSQGQYQDPQTKTIPTFPFQLI